MIVRALLLLPALTLPLAACPQDDAPADQDTLAPDTTADEETAAETVAPDTIDTIAPDTIEPEVDATDDVAPIGCLPFSPTGDLVARDVPGVYQLGGRVDLGLGGPLPDAMIFEFYEDATGTFDLASGGNENYKTCKQCIRFVQDIDPDGIVPAKNFFQAGGAITIDPATPPNGVDLVVTLTALEMVEVTIRAADFQTTPVENGACYRGPPSLALETGQCKPECGERVCGPDGCGGTCGAGCRDGERCRLDGSRCEIESTCVEVALEGTLLNLDAGVFRLDVTELGLGAIAGEDFVQIEFYKPDTGSFDLGSGQNRNYATCNQCVRVVVDGRFELFQRRGRLVVADVSSPMGSPELDGYVSLELQSIVLEEVIIDDEFNSMPMPNGACIELIDGVIASPLP